jgi:ABC-type nitrate/sulfonate/bicarbonate transport system permease component
MSMGSAVVESGGRPSKRTPGETLKKSSFLQNLVGVGTGIVLLLVWELAGKSINPLFASYPSQIAQELWRTTADGTLPHAVVDSAGPFIVAFALAILVGVPVGVMLGRSVVFRAAFGNYIVALYMMPVIALIPIYMLWFGLGFLVKVAIIFTMSIFPIIINTWDGVSSVPKTMVELGQTFLASNRQIVFKIVLPASIPFIMTGIRLGIGRGIVAMIVAEFFTGVTGLGALIIMASNQFNTPGIFAPIFVLMLIGVGLTRLVGWAEHAVAPWQDSIRSK